MTTLSVFGIKNNIPIKHSKMPNNIMNAPKPMNAIVASNRDCTRGLAGLKPATFRAPNQKKTMNKATRAKGTDMRLQKWMNFMSKLRVMIFALCA